MSDVSEAVVRDPRPPADLERSPPLHRLHVRLRSERRTLLLGRVQGPERDLQGEWRLGRRLLQRTPLTPLARCPRTAPRPRPQVLRRTFRRGQLRVVALARDHGQPGMSTPAPSLPASISHSPLHGRTHTLTSGSLSFNRHYVGLARSRSTSTLPLHPYHLMPLPPLR